LLEWTDAALEAPSVEAAGGRHRYQALMVWREKEQQALKKAQDTLTKLQAWKVRDTDAETRQGAAIEEISTRISKCGHWMVYVYDQGK
jgi:hypothetical protein